ncbi:hypothetical protein CUMW_247360 [Citrus unshiu]|uniref:Protein kinase domain-containing protein n=1 Tax=Citrus unshiu TaxID=55188 RepID=A0A2H5QNT6_CITUN|nr:hypothetical protein CUMW_247360 [Citrus unshiu]
MWAFILAGEIPTEMGNLQNLDYLALNSNNLTGSIPPTIFNISTITRITLAQNHFTGHLPSTIGHSLPNMDWLSLAKNKLSGTIPNSITNASKLSVLDLSYNSFSGLIPSTFGNLRFLGQLNLAFNHLTTESSTGGWSFLSSLTSCRMLAFLGLGSNPLRGILPPLIGNFSESLQKIFAHDCKIRGSIPQEIGNLHGVILLSLFNNDLDGTIPASMGTLKTLQVLYLDANNLQGYIPSDLCRLERLTGLFLNENKLFGHIPQCLGSLTSLRTLFLSSNTLTSSIPSSLWSLEYILYVNLSTNSLSGPLSSNIQNLKVLIELDLSRNQLSGDIPVSIGGLKDLVTLSLARNQFYGPIPESFGSLIMLESLDLSSNNLSGEIPKSMEVLSYLKQLNVSHNRLEGGIPVKGPFRNISARSIFGNYALCGPPRLQVPPCKEDNSNGSKKATVLKYTLPLIISSILITIVFNLQLERAFRSFASECEVLRNVRHRNLIKIISSCCNTHFKALVLEFMPNGSLEKWLYSHNYFLDILERLNIMIDVGSALEYLHQGHSSTPVVHCDLKPSNILLDENMVAQYGSEGIISTKCDVYSYGVLVMETFTRKKPTDEMFTGEISLRDWVKESLPHALIDVVDANLVREEQAFSAKMDCLLSIMHLALDCCIGSPEERVSMKGAAATLRKIRVKFLDDVAATI